MEDQLLQLLASTQSSAAGPRQQAEESLQALYANEALPLSLVSVASHTSLDTSIRQSALLTLRQYVLAGWSPELDEFKGQVFLGEETKVRVRAALLELSTSESAEFKIQNAASYVVSKIASVDFPEQWPGLLETLLALIPTASDVRLHGALKVLADLVQEGLDEVQFFQVAQNLVNILYGVASNEARKPKLRALAVSVFKECFNTLQVIVEDHKAEVRAFAEESLGGWVALLLGIINTELPATPEGDNGAESGPLDLFRGLVALKVQVSRVLITIRTTFPSVISPQSPALFSAVWQELSRLQPFYHKTYVEEDVDESRLEDADGLPYTLDFLVLEDLDFMQGCLRAPPVRKELEAQLKTQNRQGNWITDLMKLIVSYAQITTEEQGMWEIDVNVFLAEETNVTANYTARIACGDLVIKLGEWLKDATVEGLLIYTRELFSAQDESAWRPREAALYVLDQVLNDFNEYERKLDPHLCQSFLEYAQHAEQSVQPFLRARGYMISGTLVKSSGELLYPNAENLISKTLNGIRADGAEVVQVSCIRALQRYLQALPPTTTQPMQAVIIHALQQWLSSKDVEELKEGDDLLITLVETLRDVIMLDTRICLNGEGLNLLFSMVSHGAENFQMTNLVSETFEEICSTIMPLGSEAYVQLCQRVLPSITGAFDVANITEENSLTSLAAELLATLSSNAPSPLPPGYVSAVLPKLSTHLLHSTDDELLKSCTTSLNEILVHDTPQLLSATVPASALTPGAPASQTKSGLDVSLAVVDRLLGPAVDDNAAAEVGSLAATLVANLGAPGLGSYLLPLLQAVAQRVATAEKAHLIQSLLGVFARLSATAAKDVVDFLAGTQVTPTNGQPTHGLAVVLEKWLSNTGSFAGYEAIRANAYALSRIYDLQDVRIAALQVRGDIVVPTDGRIVTRSRAKTVPEQYTSVPATVKIVKVLVEELVGAAASGGAGMGADGAARQAAAGLGDDEDEEDDDDDDDGDWEDEPEFLGGMSRAELAKFADETPGSARLAGGDSETAGFLEGWFREKGKEPGFEAVYAQLNDDEKEKLRILA